MFIGHAAVALASKKAAPRVSLGTLIAAPFLLDLIWPVLVLLGVEHVRVDIGNTAFTHLDFYDYPVSHSLLTSIVWAMAAGAAYFVVRRDRRGAGIVALGVISHWVFDFVVHRPDLPLWPGGPKVGLGMWNSKPATLIVELLLFFGALVIYLRATRAKDRTGSIAFWALIVFLLAIYAVNATSTPPADADPKVIAASALALVLLIPWGAWIDRHREARG
jgi:cytochrome bd-type quinol oxidase subunit 2